MPIFRTKFFFWAALLDSEGIILQPRLTDHNHKFVIVIDDTCGDVIGAFLLTHSNFTPNQAFSETKKFIIFAVFRFHLKARKPLDPLLLIRFSLDIKISFVFTIKM